MTQTTKHAVVIGGSMAGLLAAQALARHFTRVTLVERDDDVDDMAARKGVPQARHLHVLLAAGMASLERTFPGIARDAVALGAVNVDIGNFGVLYLRGVRMKTVETGLRSLMISRPALESLVRARVLQNENVVQRSAAALGLIGDAQSIRGIALRSRGAAHEESLSADLVVDASGKGSRLPAWLDALGVPNAPEELVRSNVSYSTCTIRRRADHLGGANAWVMTPLPPLDCWGAAQAWEGDRYVVTFTTYLGRTGPKDYREMIECARALPYPGMHALLVDAEPLSEVVTMRDPVSRRRRYDRVSSWPEGLLAVGDSLCSFNPAYGQGMSVAALEGEALARCLARGVDELPQRFFRAAARIVDAPWMLATGADFQWPGVEGKRPFGISLLNAYVARVIEAAGRDPVVTEKLVRVMHLIDAPFGLFAPSVVWRVLRGPTRGERSDAANERVRADSPA